MRVRDKMVTQITTDTTWTSDQTDTTGFNVDGVVTLTIDAVNSVEVDNNIDCICGAGGAGALIVRGDATILLVTDDSHKIYIGGTAAQNADGLQVYGTLRTDYQGATNTITAYLGEDDAGNMTTDRAMLLQNQDSNYIIENIKFTANYSYGTQFTSTGAWLRKCMIGDSVNNLYAAMANAPEMWFEDCDFRTSNANFWVATGYGGIYNLVGSCDEDGKTFLPQDSNFAIRYWKRAYLRFINSVSGSPVEGAFAMLVHSTGQVNGWQGITGSDGKINPTTEALNVGRFPLNYLLAHVATIGCFLTPQTHSGVGQHKLIVYAPGYATYVESVDMSTDWGSASSFVDIELTPSSNHLTQSDIWTEDLAGNVTDEFEVGDTGYVDGEVRIDATVDIEITVIMINPSSEETELGYAEVEFTNDVPQSLRDDIFTGDDTLLYEFTEAGIHTLQIEYSGDNITAFTQLIKFTVTAASPQISSVSVDDSTPTQDQDVVLSATFADTDDATVLAVDSLGVVVAVYAFPSVDGAQTLTLAAGSLPVGSITLHIWAYNDDDKVTIDSSATLTVSASSASYPWQAAKALETIFKADARLTDDINALDIMVLPHEKDIENLPKFPAVAVIPGDYTAEPHTVTLRLYRCEVWVIALERAWGKTIKDMTGAEDVHKWIQAINDIAEEQNDDPDKKLSGLADHLHTVRCTPRIYERRGRGGNLYAAISKVEVQILAA